MKSGENNNNDNFKNKNPFFQSPDNLNDVRTNKLTDPDNPHKFKVLPGGRNDSGGNGANNAVNGDCAPDYVKKTDKTDGAAKQKSRYEEITARGLYMLNGGKYPDNGRIHKRRPFCSVNSGDREEDAGEGAETNDVTLTNESAAFNEAAETGAGADAGNDFGGHGYMPYRLVNPLSVVVVDENPAVLLTIMQTLQPCGYAVRAYKCAYDALLALKTEPCNVLIATEKMKQMSGSTLAEFAKTAGDAMHILLLTDRWDNNVMNSIRRERIDGYLIKPLSKNELLDKLNAIMDVT